MSHTTGEAPLPWPVPKIVELVVLCWIHNRSEIPNAGFYHIFHLAKNVPFKISSPADVSLRSAK